VSSAASPAPLAWLVLLLPWGVAVILAASAYVAGRLVAGRLPVTGSLEQTVVATALGLGLLGEAALTLASLGRLQPSAILPGLAAIHLAGRGLWRRLPGELARRFHALRQAVGRRPWPAAAVAALAFPTVALLAIFPLYPPTAFDATLYHLPFVRAFATTGSAPFLPALRFPIFPQLAEMVMALGAIFAGDLGAQCLSALATALTAGLVYVWGRQTFAEVAAAGGESAAALLGNPVVIVLAGTAYIEPFLALWATAALFSLHRFRSGAGRRWIVAAGAFAGFAAASKYLGLLFPAVGGLLVLLSGRPSRTLGRRFGDLLMFAAAGLAAAFPWYARLIVATGNPIFPFFGGIFGTSPWAPVPDPDTMATQVGSVGEWLSSLIRLPLNLLTGTDRLGLKVPMSPAFLAGAPLLIAAAWRQVRVRHLLLLTLAYALAVSGLPADVRYLTPMLPLLSVALGGCIALGARRLPSTAARAVVALLAAAALLLPSWAYGAYRLYRAGPPPHSEAQREAYLARELPMYRAVRWLNERWGPRYALYALGAENMMYFAAGRFMGDWNGPARYSSMPPVTGDPEMLSLALRRLGADHLLLPNSPSMAQATARPVFRQHFRLIYRDEAARVFSLLP
jgi:hypothetical protein